MADVFIACSVDDYDRARLALDALEAEGWSVACEPANPADADLFQPDDRAGSAGAVVVLWSGQARESDQVRAEAATALYKNKLVQARLDALAPPRPFDHVEAIDLSDWRGAREHSGWSAVIRRVRECAGAPGQIRPMVLRPIAATKPASPPPPVAIPRPAPSAPANPYAPARPAGGSAAVVIAAAAAAAAAAWLIDPFGWFGVLRETREAEAATTNARFLNAGTGVPRPRPAGQPLDWKAVDIDDPAQLRAYVAGDPDAPEADAARSLLRVLDAQAWMAAVTDDNEAGYRAYLEKFPQEAVVPGAMAAAAESRMAEIGQERANAIRYVQKGLSDLKLYSGPIDGRLNLAVSKAAQDFARRKGAAAPSLAGSAPRELREFGDLVAAEGTTPGEQRPAQPSADAASRRAAEADEARLRAASEAQAAAVAAAEEEGADTLAARQLRASDDAAWERVRVSGFSRSALEGYVRNYPNGAYLAAARSELAKPGPFELEALSPELAAAAGAARRAQQTARERAQAARDAAARADAAAAAARSGGAGTAFITAPDGDIFAAEARDGTLSGLGVKIEGAGPTLGDRYRGQLEAGATSGLGVYEFANNANNADAAAARYEGEHAGDRAAGYGVTYWARGDYLAGETAEDGSGRGVITYANGQRYEGQLRNGLRDGLGIVWSSSGEVVSAGRWANGELVEPMRP